MWSMTRNAFRLSLLLPLACLLLPIAPLHAQADTNPPQAVFLWPNGTPDALGTTPADQPRMYLFLPKKRSTSAAILVIPGGGYTHVAIGHEGFQVADWLNHQGMAAFVLDYRVKPYHYPAEIEDGVQAMRLIRSHASEYAIDPNRIGVWGSSAGGHLASSLGTHCGNAANPVPSIKDDPLANVSCRPDFMVLAYPVIGMQEPITHHGSMINFLGPDPAPGLARDWSNQDAVTANTPPTFIFATENDPTVPIENEIAFYQALINAHVHAELHIFDYSNHGCGLCGSIIPLRVWPSLLRTWLIDQSFLPPDAPPPPPPAPNWPVWPKGLEGPGNWSSLKQ